ncbi:MAG: hypothetical protein CME70_09485 [Halobacteriovorax sp.]|nr:hypothetical protein [Halobacteriovorax sp.]|tara:strand:+ start:169895 stop:171808 length:1914 start_codon:yes stop_codon:yes gene_type:complete
MIRGLFLYILLILVCEASFANTTSLQSLIQESRAKNLSQTKEWKNLLHWRWNLFGGTESEADTKSFFFSEGGNEDLQLELEATINAFAKSYKLKSMDDHPICKFPSRYLFLKRHLKTENVFKDKTCPKYENFFNKLSAKGISLVFSSYFISRPASAFGHTLMRFSKNADPKEGQKYELLDYAANYSANVTTGNAFLYGLMGLAGGFMGEFATMPYFYKIREYSDFESRDLWDYHLNLKPIEIKRIIAHLWEMGSTGFRYYYLTENCSYHMLGLIDIANPDFGLTDRVPYFVIPADTIAIIANTPGLLKGVTYRPSKMTVLKHRLSLLNKDERKDFDKIVKDLKPVALSGPKESKAKVLDTVLDFIDFEYAEQVLMKESNEVKVKNKFLIERAKLGIKSEELKVPTPEDEMPHLGHKARRVTLGAGTSSKSDVFSKLEYRFAMHDLLDLSTGQNPNATMEMAHLQFRYNLEDKFRNNSSSFRVDEVSIAQVYALTPMEKYFSDLSWRANFGGRTIKDGGCNDCFAPTAQVGAGATYKMGPVLAYLMGATEFDFNKRISHRGFRLAVGPEIKFLLRLGKTLSWDLSGDWKKNYFVESNKSSYSYSSEIRFHTFQNLNFGLKYKRHHRFWDGIAKMFIYF